MKKIIKKGTHIVIVGITPYSRCPNGIKKNYCYVQAYDSEVFCPKRDSNYHIGTIWSALTADRQLPGISHTNFTQFENDNYWRLASAEEIKRYDDKARPFDVTKSEYDELNLDDVLDHLDYLAKKL